MKHIVIILLAGVLFSSCSTTYYYSRLNTANNHVFKTDRGDFVTENDSLYIIYSFFGENCPINIGVYNKTDQGLFVDWSQSVLVVNDITYAYRTVNENGQAVPKSLDFIAPKTQANHTSFQLSGFPFDKISKEKYEKHNFHINYKTVKVDSIYFTEQNSPLRLRSHITVYDGDPSGETCHCMTFDQSFYMASLMRTKGNNVKPEDLMEYITELGDFFYVRQYKESGFGQVMAVIGIGIAYVAMEVLLPSGY
ncbi:MAG: hypothetical protein LBL90_02465 [Prevotellaceae bacterium]|jgi:hypothetical protein|nr:hypothetical protein [Prevotellaceae bacterium]